MTLPISVIVYTKNEAQDLPGCLASVTWSDDVHVLDSLSDDHTVRVAEAAGATVTERRFDDWASHQRWAMRHVPFRHPWVFYLDADERATPGLVAGLEAAIHRPGDWAAFRIQRRDFFQGRWLKHVQTSPFYLRLFRPERMSFERIINSTPLADGPVGDCDGCIDHFPFSKGIVHWVARHNSYSTAEAQQILENRRTGTKFSVWSALFERDFHRRRFHQKELFYRMPARPVLKFLLLYGLKRGFLDGGAGLSYALLQSFYEYLIVLKTREMEAEAHVASTEAPEAASAAAPL